MGSCCVVGTVGFLFLLLLAKEYKQQGSESSICFLFLPLVQLPYLISIFIDTPDNSASGANLCDLK